MAWIEAWMLRNTSDVLSSPHVTGYVNSSLHFNYSILVNGSYMRNTNYIDNIRDFNCFLLSPTIIDYFFNNRGLCKNINKHYFYF